MKQKKYWKILQLIAMERIFLLKILNTQNDVIFMQKHILWMRRFKEFSRKYRLDPSFLKRIEDMTIEEVCLLAE